MSLYKKYFTNIPNIFNIYIYVFIHNNLQCIQGIYLMQFMHSLGIKPMTLGVPSAMLY